jgi:hypothetical protein
MYVIVVLFHLGQCTKMPPTAHQQRQGKEFFNKSNILVALDQGDQIGRIFASVLGD